MSATAPEKHEFQAEVKQLLDIVIHSLYTNKEIFVQFVYSHMHKRGLVQAGGSSALGCGGLVAGDSHRNLAESVLEGDVVAGIWAKVHLAWADDAVLGVVEELHPEKFEHASALRTSHTNQGGRWCRESSGRCGFGKDVDWAQQRKVHRMMTL